MLKQTITYKDFNGEEQTEDFYFNLTQAEATATELSGEGNSFSDHMNRVIKAANGREIIKGMQEIIKLSYGIRTANGAKFDKSPEILRDFTSSNAYSVLFMKLATDAGFAAEFANGIMPEDLDLSGVTPENSSQVQPTSNATKEETPSERARRESEARLQGFKNKQEAKGSQIVDVPRPEIVAGPTEGTDDGEELTVVNKPLTAEEIDALPISEEQKSRLHNQIGE
jgi:hypothetical protein